MKVYTDNINLDEPFFPIIDLDFNWDDFKERMVPFYTDQYIYSCSMDVFRQYYCDHLVVDTKSNIFKIVHREKTSFIRSFVFCKYELIFENQKSTLELSKVKEYIVENIKRLNHRAPDGIYEEIILEVRSAKSIDDICNGKKINFQFY